MNGVLLRVGAFLRGILEQVEVTYLVDVGGVILLLEFGEDETEAKKPTNPIGTSCFCFDNLDHT